MLLGGYCKGMKRFVWVIITSAIAILLGISLMILPLILTYTTPVELRSHAVRVMEDQTRSHEHGVWYTSILNTIGYIVIPALVIAFISMYISRKFMRF